MNSNKVLRLVKLVIIMLTIVAVIIVINAVIKNSQTNLATADIKSNMLQIQAKGRVLNDKADMNNKIEEERKGNRLSSFKTEEEKKQLIETYFENEVEFSKYTFYNFGTEQKLVIIPRYDTVFVSLTDTTDKNYNPLVEDVRGKSVLVNLNTTGANKTLSLVFSHLINNTEVTLQNNPETGELKLTKENPRVKVLSLDGTKTEPKKENNL